MPFQASFHADVPVEGWILYKKQIPILSPEKSVSDFLKNRKK